MGRIEREWLLAVPAGQRLFTPDGLDGSGDCNGNRTDGLYGVFMGALEKEALLRQNEAGEKLPVALACDHGPTKALQPCTVLSIDQGSGGGS